MVQMCTPLPTEALCSYPTLPPWPVLTALGLSGCISSNSEPSQPPRETK